MCVLYRLEVLEQMPPFLGGGEMIQDVFLDHSTYAEPPSRFEAGTPAIAEAIGLGAAVDYLSDIGMEKVHAYEQELGGYLYQQVLLSALQELCVHTGNAHLCHICPICQVTAAGGVLQHMHKIWLSSQRLLCSSMGLCSSTSAVIPYACCISVSPTARMQSSMCVCGAAQHSD